MVTGELGHLLVTSPFGHVLRLSVCPSALEMRNVWGDGLGLRDRCETDMRLHRYRRMYQARVSLINVSFGR